MPHPDDTARLLAQLDHLRAWIHDHPDARVIAADVSRLHAPQVHLELASLLRIGAPTRAGSWSTVAWPEGALSRCLYLDLDGLCLVACQVATVDEVERAFRTADDLRVAL